MERRTHRITVPHKRCRRISTRETEPQTASPKTVDNLSVQKTDIGMTSSFRTILDEDMTEPVSQQEERVTLTDTQWRCLLYGTLAKGETPDVEQIMTPPVAKLSRSKNLKTERDYIEKSARNRSKSRYKATQ